MREAARDFVGPGAIKFASMKVSSISEDGRRVLDICRSEFSFPFFSTGSFNFCRRTVELARRKGEGSLPVDAEEPCAAYLRDEV